MRGLETELTETKKNLQTENDEHGMLRVAIGVICDDLEVTQTEGTSSLAARIIEIMAQVHALERNALYASILQSFLIAQPHYRDSIDLGTMCNRTVQIIRAQVQKQAPKRSNFQT
jgi:hypothetical protein